MWERSFVSMSVLLGSSVDEAVASLGEPTRAGDVVDKLRDARKAMRAQVLAMTAAELKLALDEGALR